MPEIFKRDLSSELNQINNLLGMSECTIGSDPWKLCHDSTDGNIVGTSLALNPMSQVALGHSYTLDGERMSSKQGGIGLVIRKSAITSINPNPLHPKTVAKFYEFGAKDLWKMNTPMRAIVATDIKFINFPNYFASYGTDSDRLCCSVDSPHTECCLNGIKLTFNKHNFWAYEYCTGTKITEREMVIESEEAMLYADFCECVRRILMTIGFFTGTYKLGQFWIFNAQTHDFVAYNDCMPTGGNARYHMWSLNPYEYLSEADKEMASQEVLETATQKIRKELKPITRIHFEKLLSLLNGKEFAHLFYIFQDICLNTSCLTASAKFPLYSTCLEACRKWRTTVQELDKNKAECHQKAFSRTSSPRFKFLTACLKLVKKCYAAVIKKIKFLKICKSHLQPCESSLLLPKAQRKQISRDIKDILRKYPGAEVCMNRINNLFYKSNMDLIQDAFEDVGVRLSEDDKIALGWRNSITHGTNIIKSSFDNDNPNGYIDEVEGKLFALHNLIWRFIMKSIGYEGKYIDVAKRDELFRKSKSSEGLNTLIKDV